MCETGILLKVEVHSSTCGGIVTSLQASCQSPGASHHHTAQDVHSRERLYGNIKQVNMFSDFITFIRFTYTDLNVIMYK